MSHVLKKFNKLSKVLPLTALLLTLYSNTEATEVNYLYKKQVSKLAVTASAPPASSASSPSGSTSGGSSTTGPSEGKLEVSSSAVSFGGIPVNGGAVNSVTVQNNGTSSLSLTSLTISGTEFQTYAPSTTCSPGQGLAPGASCNWSIVFVPTSMGAKSSAGVISSSAGAATVNLAGVGTQATADLTPTTHSFGNVPIGTLANITLFLQNAGNIPLPLTPVVSSNPNFTINSSTCGTAVPAGSTCEVVVHYAPSIVGTETSNIIFNTGVGIKQVALSATAVKAGVDLSSNDINFGKIIPGQSLLKVIELTNNYGTATLSAPAISGDSRYTVESTSCGSSLSSLDICQISVRFTASSTTTVSPSNLVLSINNTATSIPLTAEVALPNASFSETTTYDFGQIGTTSSATAEILVSNTGNTSITNGFVQLSGATSFSIVSTTCGTSADKVALNASSTCSVFVRYAPSTTVTETGTLSYSGDNQGSIQRNLTGTGRNIYSASEQVLFNFEGATVESSEYYSRVITKSGSPTLSSSQKVFGTKGLSLTGGAYVTASALNSSSPGNEAYDFGSGNFTVDAWINPTSCVSNSSIISSLELLNSATTRNGWYMFLNASCVLTFQGFNGGGSPPALDVNSSSSTIPTNTWSHIAAVRNGSSIKLYINGIQVGSNTTSTTIARNTSDIVRIGSSYINTGMTWNYTGYVDNVRIRKGVVAWTGNFTPPTQSDY